MAQHCGSCGRLRDHVRDYGCRNSYPSASSDKRGESSKNSNSSVGYSHNSTNGLSYVEKSILQDMKNVQAIKPPNAIIDGIDLNKVSGWHVPSDIEIAKGVNPHFKIVSGDSEQCIIAKTKFNQSISDAFNVGSTTSGLGVVAEVIRIKKELNDSQTAIKQNCNKAFGSVSGSNVIISASDFHKYL